MDVCLLCCVGSDKLISYSEELPDVCSCVWDTEASLVTQPRPELGRCATENKNTLNNTHFCRTVSLCSGKTEVMSLCGIVLLIQ
jgi:hypothetical protein